MAILAKIEDKSCLKFITDYLEGLRARKEKIARVSQLLFIIYDDNYQKCMDIVEEVLVGRLELHNTFLHTLVNTVINLPDRYLIDSEKN